MKAKWIFNKIHEKGSFRIMSSTKKNDEAVSPVIGIILMVAITVILAAIIASYVFESAPNVEKAKIVATTVQRASDGDINIIYQGGQDDNSLLYLMITAPDSSKYISTDATEGYTLCPSGDCSSIPYKKPIIGKTMKLPRSTIQPGRNHILITGTFGDQTSRLILDIFV